MGLKFHKQMEYSFQDFLREKSAHFLPENTMKIDLHCHDHNSDVPDELWGRILALPETYLPTKDLVSALKREKVDLLTITNHNNARSCYDLLSKGHDVLVGAEFTVGMPEADQFFHVLTYGFNPNQEEQLNLLRPNIYKFLSFTSPKNI